MTYYNHSEMKEHAKTDLDNFGIPDPRGLIGKSFELSVSAGSHQFYAVGTFTGFAWSDEEGLMFFISVPEYRGRPIRYVTIDDHQWLLRLEDDVSGLQRAMANADSDEAFSRLIDAHRFVRVTLMDFEGQ